VSRDAKTANRVDRSRAPEPDPIETYRFPEFTRRTEANGLTVLPARVRAAPVVELQLLFPAGGRFAGPDRPGLATFVNRLLEEGTEEHTALEIAARIEHLGGHLDAGANWNVASTTVRVLADDLDEGLDLLAEVSMRPSFPEEELERSRRNRLTDLLRRHDRPGLVAIDHFFRAVYGGSIYAHPLAGTPEGIRSVRRRDVVDFYRERYRLGNAALLAVGDVDPAVLERAVRRRFGGIESPPAAEVPEPEVPDRDRVRIRVIDRPGSPQTELRMGHAAVPRTHPDWTPLAVLNTLFGGKFTSRINLVLRERHGVTYGVSSRFVPRLGRGPFLVGTAVANEGTGLAVRAVLSELERLRQEPVGEEELRDTKSYLLGIFPYNLQTVGDIVYHLGDLVVYDLPDDHYTPERYLARLEAVDREEILRVARAHLHPDRTSVIAVGPAAELAPQLQGLGELEIVTPDAR
jgi:zinc protease